MVSEASSITLKPEAEKVSLGGSDVAVTKLGIGAWSWGDTFFWNDGSWDGMLSLLLYSFPCL